MHPLSTTLLLSMLLLNSFQSKAEEPVVSTYRDIYLTSGVTHSAGHYDPDIKFQLSLKVRPIKIGETGSLFFAYTQRTIWNAYYESSPFKDNAYMPGVYFEKEMKNSNRLLLGLEHKSNGRPYFGNPLYEEGKDDYSRGMNYLLAKWTKEVGPHMFGVELKFGGGCGVGDKSRHDMMWTQDLFLYYEGYLTLDYRFEGSVWSGHASCTPIYNKSIANVLVESSFRLGRKCPICPFIQFHYGFDEAMCDCAPGNNAPISIRGGIKLCKTY